MREAFFIYPKDTMPTVVSEECKRALSRAKIALMSRRDSAFFTTLCFSMKYVWNETIPTAQTDGLEIHINPTFWMELHPEEQLFVLVHECCHPAYEHLDRILSYKWNLDKGNIAADHVINVDLKLRGFRVPDWVYCDLAYRGMSMEKVYKLLPPQPPQPDKKMDGDINPGKHRTPEEKQILKRQIEDILVRAKMASELAKDKPGSIPGEMDLIIKGLMNPKLPWHRIVAKWMRSFDKTDYTWRKPNRRHFPEHHLPSLWGESLMDLACFTDISGSVSDDDYKRYVSEIHGLLKQMRPKKLTFGQFDVTLKQIDVIRNPADLLKVRFHGRGGTRIREVIQWLNKNKPQGALIFSDGDFRFHEEDKTDVPVIWIVHDRPSFDPPFGKVVHFHM
jgi:predicted metal-dependent peptidase